jgi:hypothetical protein
VSAAPGDTKDQEFTWRQVSGAFQVRIPVTNAKVMLPVEENTLAILKWRLQESKAPYRWRPVWERYIELEAARVKGLGGDPNNIPPSLGGYRPSHDPCKDKELRREFTGKVISLTFDRFGDFDGFILDTEDGNRRFTAREPEIQKVVNRAWSERILTTVIVELDALHRPEKIVLHCPPSPLKY